MDQKCCISGFPLLICSFLYQREESRKKQIQELNNQKAATKIQELEKAKQNLELELHFNKKRLEMETLATKQVTQKKKKAAFQVINCCLFCVGFLWVCFVESLEVKCFFLLHDLMQKNRCFLYTMNMICIKFGNKLMLTLFLM